MDRLPRPSLEAIRAFAVFAETLNFSAAARSLHISQPALHMKVNRLARELDVPLYTRDGRRLVLTRHGEFVAQHGRDLHERTRLMLERVGGRVPEERVVLAAGEGAFLYLLGPALRHFTRHAGAAKLTLLTLDRDATVQAVLAGKAHIGVAPLQAVPDDLAAEPLRTVGQILVMPRQHPLARRKLIKLADLTGARLVVPRPGQPQREMLAAALDSAQVPWKVAVEAGGWELMIEFVRLGLGLAVVNDYCEIPAALVSVPVPDLPSLKFQICTLTGAKPQGHAARLLEALREGAKRRVRS
jgi:DNA-binding transcriptional LysR family regulator